MNIQDFPKQILGFGIRISEKKFFDWPSLTFAMKWSFKFTESRDHVLYYVG